MALEKLLSLPERQQLEEAGAGLLLWDEDEEEEEDRGVTEKGRDLVAPRRRSEGDRKKSEGGDAFGLLVDTRAGGHRLSAPASAPPTVTLPLAPSYALSR